MEQSRTTWKWILTIFKYKCECYKQSGKVDEKNGTFCLVSMFSSWVRVLKLSKKVHFLKFCADFSKKLKKLRYMHLKVLITLFQKIIWFAGVWATAHEILAIKISKMILCRNSKKISSFSNPNISKTVSHRIINNTISWKCITRPFRYIHVNCFKRLRYLAEVSTKLQKCTFLDNLRTITQDGNMKTRQAIPCFDLLFPL